MSVVQIGNQFCYRLEFGRTRLRAYPGKENAKNNPRVLQRYVTYDTVPSIEPAVADGAAVTKALR